MAADGKGVLDWSDPDLDFWPMTDLSTLNLSWLDQTDLRGNLGAVRTSTGFGDETRSTTVEGRDLQASALVSFYAAL